MKTVKEIKEQIEGDIRSAFRAKGHKDVKVPLLLQILSTVFSYLFFSLHRKMDHLVDNLFLQNVKDEKIIKNFLEQYDIATKIGEKAKGKINVKATKPTLLKKNTEFSYSAGFNSLFTFLTVEDISLKPNADSDEVQNIIEVEASDIGGDYNLPSKGENLTLTNSEAGILKEAKVVSEIAGGSDNESLLEAKGRLLNRIRTIRTGGTIDDYSEWALRVDGVHRTFVYPNYPHPGQVTIHFIINSASNYIPIDDKIEELKKYISPLSPAGVKVLVDKPKTYEITVKIFDVKYTDDYSSAYDDDNRKKDAEGVIASKLGRFLLTNAKPGEHLDDSYFSTVIGKSDVVKGHGKLEITCKYNGKDLTEKNKDATLYIPPKAIGVIEKVVIEKVNVVKEKT